MDISYKIILISIIIMSFIFLPLGNGYVSASLGDKYGISDQMLEKIKGRTEKITYEMFGAVGDGKTNDIDSIRKAHDFANELYVTTGEMYSVYASKKTYYLGDMSGKGPIDIATNVHWRNASFIVDDYIDNNKDSFSDVDATEALFNIVSPLKIFSKLNNRNLYYFTYADEIVESLSSSEKINSNTKNLRELVDALYDGKMG